MKIGMTTFGCDLKSGMSRYVSSLIAELSLMDGTDQIEILAHDGASEEYLPKKPSDNIKLVSVSDALSSPLLNVFWHQTSLPLITEKRGFDALFLPAASRRTPYWCACPTIGTIHDMSPFHIAGKYDPARNFYQTRVLPKMLRRLTHIIAISESTKRDIERYADVPAERISVIHHAADTNVFYPRDSSAVTTTVKSYGIHRPYIVYISRIESPAKNHTRLIDAFEILKRDEGIPHQLVLAGADWHGAEDVHQAARDSPFSSDILLTGFVRAGDLADLYCGADLMIFPSLFEGFGLPILEAMACGVPVACSNVSSMPEIAGDAAALFDPLDVESIADAANSILGSIDRSESYRKKGLERARSFSWKKTASQTVDVIHRVSQS